MDSRNHATEHDPSHERDVVDLSALLFAVAGFAVISVTLTVGVTLVVAWMLRNSLTPVLGVG